MTWCRSVEEKKEEYNLKFEDLKRGKMYRSNYNLTRYKLNNNALWNCDAVCYSNIAMDRIMKFKFKEIELPFKDRVRVFDEYYYITSSLKTKCVRYSNNDWDEERIEVNNFFEIRSLAQSKINKIKEVLLND